MKSKFCFDHKNEYMVNIKKTYFMPISLFISFTKNKMS